MTPEEILARVNFHGCGAFHDSFFPWLINQPPPNLAKVGDRIEIDAPVRHMKVRCRRVAVQAAPVGNDELVLERVEFLPGAALPFSLQWPNLTPAAAEQTLGNDTAAGGNAISYFLPDFLVLALHFTPAGVGLEKVIGARLGAVRDWKRFGTDQAVARI